MSEFLKEPYQSKNRIVTALLLSGIALVGCAQDSSNEKPISAEGSVSVSLEPNDIDKASCENESAIQASGMSNGKPSTTPEEAILANKQVAPNLRWDDISEYARGADHKSGVEVSKQVIDDQAVFVAYSVDGENWTSGPFMICSEDN